MGQSREVSYAELTYMGKMLASNERFIEYVVKQLLKAKDQQS